MADPISGSGSSGGDILQDLIGEAVGGDGGGILENVIGGAAGSGGFDPESMAVDLVGKMLGLNQTDLGIAKAALGAATGDPMAIAAGVEEGIAGLASGQDPFAPLEKKTDGAGSHAAAKHASEAPSEDDSDVDDADDSDDVDDAADDVSIDD